VVRVSQALATTLIARIPANALLRTRIRPAFSLRQLSMEARHEAIDHLQNSGLSRHKKLCRIHPYSVSRPHPKVNDAINPKYPSAERIVRNVHPSQFRNLMLI